MITVDMAKAREIHKDNISVARAGKFPELDIEFNKALETSADTTAIVAKKKALRDAPAASAIASASTPAELKATWDTALLGETPYKT